MARWQEAQEVTQANEPLQLPYRELQLDGQWRTGDYTDATVCLLRNDGGRDSVWLMTTRLEKPTRVLPTTQATRPDFVISGVSASDEWLAWEEVGPGDDLAQDVPWRLYAAPIRSGFSLGRPRLIAEASTGGARRPLFNLDDSWLVWTSGQRTSRHGFDSRLVVQDLAGGKPRVLYRTDDQSNGDLHVVTLKDGAAIVMETPELPRPLARFAVLDLMSGERLAGIDVANEHPLSHWPAWREGWLAWAPFPQPEAQFPELFLRAPDGRVWFVGQKAHDAVFVGPYLFYTDNPHEGASLTWRVDVRALRLDDVTSFSLVSGKPGLGDWWHGGGFGAPDVEHTFVAYDNRAHTDGAKETYDTLVRVYQVE